MNETTFRDLLHQAMAGAEPSAGPHIIGGAVRAARRTRRRRWAVGLGVAAVVVPSLALGVPAALGALAPAVHDSRPGLAPAAGGGAAKHSQAKVAETPSPSATPGPTAPPGMAFLFQRPHRLAGSPDVSPVPITSQSVGQLLIDDLPAGTRQSQIQADSDFNGSGVAYAYFSNVRTSAGAGLLQATMMRVGARPVDFGCGHDSSTCHDYRLPGGVVVSEQYQVPTATGLMLDVSVFRPNVAEFNIGEANFAEAARSPDTKGLPLTIGQILTIALDSRWQFTISQSFVQQASGLHIVPIDTSGS